MLRVSVRSTAPFCVPTRTRVRRSTYKNTIQKVRVHRIGENRILGFAAAGLHGHCDGLEGDIVAALRRHPSGDYIKPLKSEVQKFYEIQVWRNPTQHEVSALLVMHDAEDSTLWRVSPEGTVTAYDEYASIGIGQFVANQWQTTLLPGGCREMPIDQLLALSICILWHVKQKR